MSKEKKITVTVVYEVDISDVSAINDIAGEVNGAITSYASLISHKADVSVVSEIDLASC